EQLRLALAAGADVGEAFLAVAADRKDIVGADENVDLAELGLAVSGLHCLQHRKQRIAVFLDLRPLMAMSGVLHRELVQTELRAHFLELGRLGILESYPDEARSEERRV